MRARGSWSRCRPARGTTDAGREAPAGHGRRARARRDARARPHPRAPPQVHFVRLRRTPSAPTAPRTASAGRAGAWHPCTCRPRGYPARALGRGHRRERRAIASDASYKALAETGILQPYMGHNWHGAGPRRHDARPAPEGDGRDARAHRGLDRGSSRRRPRRGFLAMPLEVMVRFASGTPSSRCPSPSRFPLTRSATTRGVAFAARRTRRIRAEPAQLEAGKAAIEGRQPATRPLALATLAGRMPKAGRDPRGKTDDGSRPAPPSRWRTRCSSTSRRTGSARASRSAPRSCARARPPRPRPSTGATRPAPENGWSLFGLARAPL